MILVLPRTHPDPRTAPAALQALCSASTVFMSSVDQSMIRVHVRVDIVNGSK